MMKATRYTVRITINVLSFASCPALIAEAMQSIRAETEEGSIGKSDGDEIFWDTSKKELEF